MSARGPGRGDGVDGTRDDLQLENEDRAVRAFVGWSPAALVLTRRFHGPANEALIASLSLPVIETRDLEPSRRPVQIGFTHRRAGAPQPHAQASRQRPDALILAKDNLACGAALAAQRAGIRIPGDIAGFGFGDYGMVDKPTPSLSTLRPPTAAIGESTARLALQLVQGDRAARAALPNVTVLACELIARRLMKNGHARARLGACDGHRCRRCTAVGCTTAATTDLTRAEEP